ncbi:MAG TPA: hypothetical protein VNY30_04705 [Bryobacteraceae bacterium]|jgi:hypothetical protein|nr:hypothetical protein [Bryobacteraceae bacterium]
MKKLMTAVLGLSLLTGLAAVSFARPDDPAPKTEKTKKKSSKKKKDTKKDETK